MDFDQIGVQRVAKRRHPSPLRNTRHQTVRDDTVFEQKVWPRPGHSGTALQFETPFPFVFDKYSTKHSKKGGNGASFGNGVSFGNEDSLNQEVFKRKNRSSATTTGSGFSIPVSWLKPVMIICGILVIGIIGPNWDGISKVFASQDVSPESLQDPGTPLVREAAFEPISIEPVAFGDPSEMGSDVTVYEETQVPAVDGEGFPLNLTKTFTSIEYEVKAGENVSVIADKFSVSMESVIALNGLKDATILYVGKKLKIPNMNGVPYTVKRNDTISRIAEREKIPETTILDANDLRSDMIYVGQVLFLPGARMNSSEYLSAIRRTPEKPMINPVTGRMFITSNYGYRLDPVNPRSGVRRFHEGIDIRGAYGASVKAAMAGTVEEVGNSRVLGNFIILNHNGYRSLYAHLSAFSVRKGARISQGQEIGKIGNSGYSTGSHLHFAVYDKNGNSVNPIGLLK